ncbi:MAG: hypothetical protein R3F30_03975 [Planctomycetota bacterium]
MVALLSLGALVLVTLLLLQRNGDPTFASTETDDIGPQQDTPQTDGDSAKEPGRVDPAAAGDELTPIPRSQKTEDNERVPITREQFTRTRGMNHELDIVSLKLPPKAWESLLEDWNDYSDRIDSANRDAQQLATRIYEERMAAGKVEKHLPPDGPTQGPQPWDLRPGEYGGQKFYYDKAAGKKVIEVVRIRPGESLDLDRKDARVQELKAIRLQRARALISRYR